MGLLPVLPAPCFGFVWIMPPIVPKLARHATPPCLLLPPTTTDLLESVWFLITPLASEGQPGGVLPWALLGGMKYVHLKVIAQCLPEHIPHQALGHCHMVGEMP